MPFWRREQRLPTGDLFLIVGLGNPGGQYARTRHNVGYMVVNLLARRAGVTFSGSKQRADVARASLGGEQVMLALPITYMNESGRAVEALVQYYRVALDQLLVVSDEMDLPFGTLRLRTGGSAAGHRGLTSIIQSLGSQDFARLRLGVGRPRGEAISHVLSHFTPDELRLLPALLDVGADAATSFVTDGAQAAMNRFNGNWLERLETPS